MEQKKGGKKNNVAESSAQFDEHFVRGDETPKTNYLLVNLLFFIFLFLIFFSFRFAGTQGYNYLFK